MLQGKCPFSIETDDRAIKLVKAVSFTRKIYLTPDSDIARIKAQESNVMLQADRPILKLNLPRH